MVNDVPASKSTFKVASSGAVSINYQSSATGSSAPSAIEVKNLSGTVNFKVKSSGFVFAREIQVVTGIFPDYVFDSSYKLMSLPELESFIIKNKHLPGFESAQHYVDNGMNVSELIIKQQEKIEELTLYNIELEKRIKSIEQKLGSQK